MAAVPLADLAAALTATVESLAQMASRASRATLAGETAQGAVASASVRLDLDVLNARVLDAIRMDGATLVRQVSEEARAAIRAAVERAYVTGQHPRTAARAIQAVVGLTRRQEAAVETYRAMLTDEGRDAAQVARMASRYANRLRRQRAHLIARTESNRAMNEGQRATWMALVAAGQLDPARWRRQWLTVLPAPGVCPICLPLDGVTIPLVGGLYPGDGDGGPPAHPNCRCSEVLVRAE